MPKAVQVIDHARIGTRGFPVHYAAYGLQPPMKWVPVSEDGTPDHNHPGLTPEEIAGLDGNEPNLAT